MLQQVRKILRPIRRAYENGAVWARQQAYARRRSPVGSPRWLIESEILYGGYVTGVARNTVSAKDPRTPEQLSFGGMTGGDRMLFHGYAPVYASHLAPFLNLDGLTIAEFGILKGTGLAIWCDLFPNARVLGFDIDLEHFRSNESELRRRGAFARNEPSLHHFDQYADGPEALATVLDGRTLDIVIDDGAHTLDAIIGTWRAAAPHLSQRFVYIIEDFADLMNSCGEEFVALDVDCAGEITVISRK